MRETIIVPIVKDQAGNHNEADNYRGIAISSTLGKMIETIVANKFQWLWHTTNQQFGFKAAHGCDMCGFVVKETVCHYLENGDECMFGCCLDLSKAYDRVSHPKLSMKLLDQGALVYLVVLLRNWYKLQTMAVRWNSIISSHFAISNGVQQGSVLSRLLFNIYMDDLIVSLNQSGFGARVNGKFTGCVMYADDIVLLSPSRTGLQSLLDMCMSFAERNFMKVNYKKSMAITFRRKRNLLCKETEFCLDGNRLKQVDEISHLGHKLSSYILDDFSAVQERCRKFYATMYS